MKRALGLFSCIMLLFFFTACRSGASPATPTPFPQASATSTPTGLDNALATPEVPVSIALEESLAGRSDLNTFLAVTRAADTGKLLNRAGGFTLFAPTDEAFARLPAALLEDDDARNELLAVHLITETLPVAQLATLTETASLLNAGAPWRIAQDAGTLRVGGAAVLEADVAVDDGVVHIVDTVLLPPRLAELVRSSTVQTQAPTDNAELPDIVETAAQYPELSTLRAGWEAAGMLEMLQAEGPFTIFAPTDTAFAAMVDAISEELLLLLDEHPGPVMLHHIAPVYVESGALQAGLVLETLQGDPITVTSVEEDGESANAVQLRSTGAITTSAATTMTTTAIVTANIRAGNGVMHLVDAVLLPASAIVPTPEPTAAP